MAPMNFQLISVVALGGAIGAVGRYLVHRGLTHWHGTEAAWSTLGVNVIGSFLLGFAAALFTVRTGPMAHFVMIGILGAFTTFSTFSMDAVTLFKDRGVTVAALYVGLSVALSLIGFVAGALTHKAVL